MAYSKKLTEQTVVTEQPNQLFPSFKFLARNSIRLIKETVVLKLFIKETIILSVYDYTALD